MSNHHVTLETAQRLNKSSFAQGTLFSWLRNKRTGYTWISSAWPNEHFGQERVCAAPILTEVLEQLPVMDGRNDPFRLMKGEVDGKVGYAVGYSEDIEHENSAEAAALLWLKLIEGNDA